MADNDLGAALSTGRRTRLFWILLLVATPLLLVVGILGYFIREFPIEKPSLVSRSLLPPSVATLNEFPHAVSTARGTGGTPSERFFVVAQSVRTRDSIGGLLQRMGVIDSQALRYFQVNPEARAIFNTLRPTDWVRAHINASGQLQLLVYPTTERLQWRWVRSGAQLSMKQEQRQVVRVLAEASTEIRSSLFSAADAIDLPDNVTLQIAQIFSGDIDFHKDLRVSDRLRVVYETLYRDGHLLSSGRVLAAEFTNQGRTHQAFWFTTQAMAKENNSKGGRVVEVANNKDDLGGAYYTGEGKPMKKTFLRSPIPFSRVSSGFGLRLHPIHQSWRQHNGIDYAAPLGTAVQSVADGVVKRSNYEPSGYGRFVEIQHAGNYSTVYAHLQSTAKGIYPGSRVRQGQMVGAVGQTGLATGPHLHYEFKVGNQAVNPLKLNLSVAFSLEGSDRKTFYDYIIPWQERLMVLRNTPGITVSY